jgi:hypothetical protein
MKEQTDVQNAVVESLNDSELKTAIEASANDLGQVEKSVVESVLQESQKDFFSSLSFPMQTLLNAGYPIDRINEAHAMVTSIMGNEIGDQQMIEMMTNYLLEGDIFASVY